MADNLVVFDLRGTLAHFRRPDTLATHATYPFFPRTALRGLIAAILGRTSIPEQDLCGLQLLAPVRTVAHQLSLHGKRWESGSGSDASFSRPTSIELVVNPAYRVYYHGSLAEQLNAALRQSRSHFHTYLGAAFCLTFPRWVDQLPAAHLQPLDWTTADQIETATVVPTPCVRRLDTADGRQYARVGGILYRHLGQRRFRGTIHVLYEAQARTLRFQPNANATSSPDRLIRFVQHSQHGTICLW